jgi:ribosomal protein L21E
MSFKRGDTMKTKLLKFIPFFVMASFLMTGCQPGTNGSTTAAKSESSVQTQAPVKKATGPVYKGKVVGKSNKSKQISIAVGKGKAAKTIMVSFDEQTKGIGHAAKGHAAIISYEIRDGVPFATVIEPKLAKLPAGVTVISPTDTQTLINSGKDFLLVDSRPAKRYSASHLPGAVSIPVCEMQELLQNLPKEKDKVLVFYGGGPT